MQTGELSSVDAGVLCVCERQAGRLLCVSPALLRKWRRLGGGPQFLRLGRCVRYPVDALRHFVMARVKEIKAG